MISSQKIFGVVKTLLGNVTASGVATAKGGNTYSLVVDNTNSSGTLTESRKMAIRVLATDLASNETTAGSDLKTSTYVYTLDSKVGDAKTTPAATTPGKTCSTSLSTSM